MTDDSTYVCPQCGPDPRGSEVHTEEMHTWHGGDPERDDSLAMALGDLDTYEAEVAKLNRQVEELRGQRDEWIDRVADVCFQRDEWARRAEALHPVVEAAEAWRDLKEVFAETWVILARVDKERLLAEAVDAWRAAQPDQTPPTDRPTPRVSQDQGADDGAGTEGSQAQGGAQGVWERGAEEAVRRDFERDLLDSQSLIPDIFDRLAAKAQPAPADPAGLDAAIEAARRSAHGVVWLDDAGQDQTIRIAVRAAAPHLRAAALNEAADEAADAGLIGALIWSGWLRERAGRIGGGE
jgi:hypothetical protein